jgi:hypothetical protein
VSTTPTRAARHRPRGAGHASLSRPVRLLAAVAGCAALLAPHAAAAQSDATTDDPAAPEADEVPEDSRVQIVVSRFTGVLGPGSVRLEDRPDAIDAPAAPVDLELRVLVENTGPVPIDSLRLVVEVHPAVDGRAALRRALSGGLGSSPIHVHDQAVREGQRLGPAEMAGMIDRFPGSETDWAGGAGGVHPVRIAVVRGTEVLDEVVTAVVWLGREPMDPLTATLVWPVDGPPWRTAGGGYPSAVDRETRTGGRLDVLVRALERLGPTPVVLAPGAHLLEDLGDRSDGFTILERQDGGSIESRRVGPDGGAARDATTMLRRIRELAAAQPHPPVSSSYVDADLAALHVAGGPLRSMAAEAAVDGRRRLQRQLGREVDGAVFLLAQHVSSPVLDLLPGEILLVPHRVTLEPTVGEAGPVPPPVRTIRTPSGRLLDAIVADPYLEESLTSPSHTAGAVVASQRIVAETAMAYLQAPTTSDRTLLLLPPSTWDPSPAVAEGILDGLLAAPWLRLTTASDQAASGRRSGEPLELAPPPAGAFPPELSSALATAVTQLDAVVGALLDGTTRIQDRTPTELRDALLRSSSSWYRGAGTTEAQALIRDVQRTIDTTFGDVEVASGSVTLTSDTGSIPITLQRTRGGPITVAVEVASQGRLVWPEGRRSEPLVLEPGAAQTVSFPTRALSTGTFPVTVRVTDPSGTHELQRTTLSVRSTAISGPALWATALLVLVLLLAGALRRKTRTPHLEVVD